MIQISVVPCLFCCLKERSDYACCKKNAFRNSKCLAFSKAKGLGRSECCSKATNASPHLKGTDSQPSYRSPGRTCPGRLWVKKGEHRKGVPYEVKETFRRIFFFLNLLNDEHVFSRHAQEPNVIEHSLTTY